MQTKNWWESKTVWGLIVIAAAQIARLGGHTITDADQTALINAATELGTTVGTILSTWGTLTRNTTIKQMAPPNQLLVLFAACALFTGCATNQSIEDGIGIGYETVKTVAQGVAIAKQNGQITATQRDEMLDRVQKAKNALDAATAALATPVTANSQLRIATALLQALQSELLRAAQNANHARNTWGFTLTAAAGRAGGDQCRRVYGAEEAGGRGRQNFVSGGIAYAGG